MTSEEEYDNNLGKYYPVSDGTGLEDLSDITLKNVSLALILLGLIAFLVNAFMVYLIMAQDWAVIWPRTSGAQIGVVLMVLGGALYLIDHLLEARTLKQH